MKIAFIGDSFCADTRQGSWPYLVKKQTKSTLVCKGKQGASQYTILKHTKKILLLKPDLVIFTHTDPYRLANRHDEPLGARPCESVYSRYAKDPSFTLKEIKGDKDNIWTAGHLYYEHLMDWGFHELTHIALVKECDKICKETNTKVLHFFSFSTKELNFRDYNWDIDLPNAYREKSLARISYDYQTPDNDEQEFIEPGWQTLPNHMNYAGNKFVSELVLGML